MCVQGLLDTCGILYGLLLFLRCNALSRVGEGDLRTYARGAVVYYTARRLTLSSLGASILLWTNSFRKGNRQRSLFQCAPQT